MICTSFLTPVAFCDSMGRIEPVILQRHRCHVIRPSPATAARWRPRSDRAVSRGPASVEALTGTVGPDRGQPGGSCWTRKAQRPDRFGPEAS
jgi:hypothetical protein